jgi:hypothetical protein
MRKSIKGGYQTSRSSKKTTRRRRKSRSSKSSKSSKSLTNYVGGMKPTRGSLGARCLHNDQCTLPLKCKSWGHCGEPEDPIVKSSDPVSNRDSYTAATRQVKN